jgi:hypothetical protein
MEVCLLGIYLSTCQIWKVLELSKIVICIFEIRALEFIGKEVLKRKRPNGPALCDSLAHLNSTEPSSVGIGPGRTRPPTSHARTHRARLKPTTPPSTGHSYWTAACHLLLPASMHRPCSTASTCATPVALNPYSLWASMRGQSPFDFPHP